MKFVPTVMLFCQISEVFWNCSLHGETENHKDFPSSAVADASGDSRHKRSSSRWKDDLSPASSTECMFLLYFTAAPSACTYCMLTPLQRTKDFNFVFYCISNIYEAFDVTFDGEMTMSNEMDLLVEQVKMLAKDIAFSTSTLKRLLEQSVNDPEALKTQVQIQNLEREIQEKRRQMRILEQRIIRSGEASLSNASLVDMHPLKPLLITRKLVQNEELRKIETIVNDQIKADLDVYAKEVTLFDAKRINGLRAVFGEIYPDPVRVVSIGKKVDDLLADPYNAEWLSYTAELCGGTHLSNTKQAKAFTLISEEGIAKGIRRVTAVTADCAFDALELAHSLDQEVIDAAKIEGSMLEKKVASLRNRVDAAPIPPAKKNDISAKISLLQKAVKAACEKAEAAISDGKGFCISCVGVGLDATAVREAVLKMDELGISTVIFNVDETTNKVVVYVGVPDKGNTSQAGSSANAFIRE
ncbi:hypothetical protein Ancab_004918 [Ancistrocladus abbreviatus]